MKSQAQCTFRVLLGQPWGATGRSNCLHRSALASHQTFRTELTASLDPASQAMLQSQSGPYASRTFTTIPFGLDTTYPSHLFRVLLLRRLRLPLPLSARICRCCRILDPLGDHRAACAQAGVLRGRGIPLERAAARVCREAGARVTTNTRLSDLNLDHINRHDDRRIEVIANGLPLWAGAQLAVDTTWVSPLTSSSQPRRRAGQYAGAALQDARKRSAHTQNFSVPDGAGSWSSPSREGAGGARKQQLSSASWPKQKPEQFPTSSAKLSKLPSCHAGQPSSHMRPSMHSRPVSWTWTSTTDGDTPSANFYQKRPFSPRLLAVSQPAPKELRLGFGPAIHAHPEPPV